MRIIDCTIREQRANFSNLGKNRRGRWMNKWAVQFSNLCRTDFNVSGGCSFCYASAGVNSRAKDLEVDLTIWVSENIVILFEFVT